MKWIDWILATGWLYCAIATIIGIKLPNWIAVCAYVALCFENFIDILIDDEEEEG